MKNKGKLIVLEGLDGSGKSTQFERVYSILSDRGNKIKKISFPDYGERSSELVKMYLAGEFSDDPSEVNAYAASTFYAAERYASYMRFWKKERDNNTDILAARYTTSNCIYQMTKLDRAQWDEYLSWLEDYEYDKFGIPRPDKVVFIDMPIEVSQKLLSSRYGGNEDKKDIHERNVDFLKACREAALYTAKQKGWFILPCSDGDNPFTPERINEQLTAMILDN